MPDPPRLGPARPVDPLRLRPGLPNLEPRRTRRPAPLHPGRSQPPPLSLQRPRQRLRSRPAAENPHGNGLPRRRPSRRRPLLHRPRHRCERVRLWHRRPPSRPHRRWAPRRRCPRFPEPPLAGQPAAARARTTSPRVRTPTGCPSAWRTNSRWVLRACSKRAASLRLAPASIVWGWGRITSATLFPST